MLEDKISERIRALISSKRPDRIDQLRVQIGTIISSMNARGVLQSSMTEQMLNELGIAEIKIQIIEARKTIERVVLELQLHYTDSLNSDLKTELTNYAFEAMETVKNTLLSYPHIINATRVNMENGYHRGLAESSAELDFFVDKLSVSKKSQASEPKSNTRINVNAGIVQFGDYSNANLTLNLNSDSKEAILKALDKANESLSILQGVNRPEELKEIVSDAYKELEKGNPNNSKLFGYLNILAAAYQGIASGSAVYVLLQNAITLFTG